MSQSGASSSHVRTLGIIEGISYILLLFVAMPLKYMADMPMGVKILGRIHGGLFVLFVLALVWAVARRGWSFERAAMAFGASIVPFGTFIMDLRDKDPDEAQT